MALLLELLLLELLFERELGALFFDPLELEPDFVGMELSLPGANSSGSAQFLCRRVDEGDAPLFFYANNLKGQTVISAMRAVALGRLPLTAAENSRSAKRRADSQ